MRAISDKVVLMFADVDAIIGTLAPAACGLVGSTRKVALGEGAGQSHQTVMN
jgi:hypothetical protein